MKDHQISSIVQTSLPNWLIFAIEKYSHGYLVTAQYALPVKSCPVCGIINPRLVKYGTKEVIRKLPTGWITVATIRQRYQCKECQHTFWEPMPGMEHTFFGGNNDFI